MSAFSTDAASAASSLRRRARTIRPGRGSSSSNREGVGATKRSSNAHGSDKLDSTANQSGAVAVEKGWAASISASALAPLVDSFKIPSWTKTSPINVVLAGRRIRLGNRAFYIAILGALTAILASLLVLNTSLAAGTFELQESRQIVRELSVREQVLSNELSSVESPVGLGIKAESMGMVPAGAPAFIDLESNTIIGEASSAIAPPAAAKKKKKKEATEEVASGEVATEINGTVDSVTGFVGTESSNSSSSVNEGLRPLGLLAE